VFVAVQSHPVGKRSCKPEKAGALSLGVSISNSTFCENRLVKWEMGCRLLYMFSLLEKNRSYCDKVVTLVFKNTVMGWSTSLNQLE